MLGDSEQVRETYRLETYGDVSDEDAAMATDYDYSAEDLNAAALGRRVEEAAAAARWASRRGDQKTLEDARIDLDVLVRMRMDKLGLPEAEAARRIGMWNEYIATGEEPQFEVPNRILPPGGPEPEPDEPGWWQRSKDRFRSSRFGEGANHVRNGNYVATADMVRVPNGVEQRSRTRRIGRWVLVGIVVVGGYIINREYVGFDMDPGIFDNDGMAWSDVPGRRTGSDTSTLESVLDDPDTPDIDVDTSPDAPDPSPSPDHGGNNHDIPDWLESQVEEDYQTLNEALKDQGMPAPERQQMIANIMAHPEAADRAFSNPVQFEQYLDWVADWKAAHPEMTDQEIVDNWNRYFAVLLEV